MKKVMMFAISAFMFFVANPIFSDTVTFAKRYFVDRASIVGEIYSSGDNKGDKIQIRMVIGGPFGLKIKFSCEDKWDWGKVARASKSIRKYINEKDDINPIKMLSEAGLSGCKRK